MAAVSTRIAGNVKLLGTKKPSTIFENIKLYNPLQLITVKCSVEIEEIDEATEVWKRDSSIDYYKDFAAGIIKMPSPSKPQPQLAKKEIINGQIVFVDDQTIRLQSNSPAADKSGLKWQSKRYSKQVRKDNLDNLIKVDVDNKRIVIRTREDKGVFVLTISPTMSKEYMTFCGFARGFMTWLWRGRQPSNQCPFDTDITVPVDYLYGSLKFTFTGSPAIRQSLAVFSCQECTGVIYVAQSGDFMVNLINELGKDEPLDSNKPIFAMENIQPKMRVINNGRTFQMGIDYPEYPGSDLEICLDITKTDVFIPRLLGQFVANLNTIHKMRGRPTDILDKFSLQQR